MNTFSQKIKTVSFWGIYALIIFALGLWIFGVWHDEWSGYNASTEGKISDGVCTIAVIPIIGEIVPYADAQYDGSGNQPPPSTNSDDVLALLRASEQDPNVLGILVRIDSPGGSSVASEIITNTLKRSSLPVAALIQETGASGAYLVATGARTIIASPFSDVGSIGVSMSYMEQTAKNAKEGLRYTPLVSAQFKDYGDPNKPLTYAERMLLERDLKIFHEQFVKEVADNRNLPIEQVAKLADGSSLPGALALEHKLIDALGDQETARAWFAEELKIPLEEVVFCE